MSDVHVTMFGYVGGEIEFKQGENNPQLDRAFFRLGSTPRFYDKLAGGWRDGETVWLTVKAWRQLAQNIASSLSVGQPVVVIGKLRTSVWKSDDGEVHSRDVLEATMVGHDLNRGTSAFRRTERSAFDKPAPAPEDSEIFAVLDQQAGDRVNPVTGEVTSGDAARSPEPTPAF
ncbi:MAG: single-stranded DNA-binding protein [Actinomycetota bacterium]|nr:single-stranded DNA-binding protein [Actinomycetota bacterium]